MIKILQLFQALVHLNNIDIHLRNGSGTYKFPSITAKLEHQKSALFAWPQTGHLTDGTNNFATTGSSKRIREVAITHLLERDIKPLIYVQDSEQSKPPLG